MPYDCVMNMSTAERRFYLSLHVKRKTAQNEAVKKVKENSSSKGTRKTTVSGAALMHKLKSGEIT